MGGGPLCRYVDQAMAGEEVVIARADKPTVRWAGG